MSTTSRKRTAEVMNENARLQERIRELLSIIESAEGYIIECEACPFCGGTGDLYKTPTLSKSHQWKIICRHCAAEGSWSWNRETAIKNWNNRSVVPEKKEA